MLKFTRSFITGSWAYGSPDYIDDCCETCDRPLIKGSDVDLVVLVNEADLAILQEESDSDAGSGPLRSRSLRFGKLNLICETTDEAFQEWRLGTKLLQKLSTLRDADIEREEAVKVMRRFEDMTRKNFSDSFRHLKLIAKARLYKHAPQT